MNQLWRVVLAAFLLFSAWEPLMRRSEGVVAVAAAAAPVAQDDLATQADSLLATMTVAERVGQLFLVTFQGDTAVTGSDIAELITVYRVGGVLLTAVNNNITGYGNLNNVPPQVAALTYDLQTLALTGAAASDTVSTLDPDAVPPTPSRNPPQTAVPLFIAINHEGSGSGYTEILHGLSNIPNNMTIGATWQPTYAQAVGQIVGQELADLGINLLLGPALDVLENPSPTSRADLGVRAFGGDPYWVGLMGKSYIQGVHMGSNGRMGVIAKSFPGNGGSDRSITEEIPTVRKSLEQLKQIELAPFFAVTNQATPTESLTDGLLTTHIRYQGFQGNIRATTFPVSFDPQALKTLMELSEFNPWRQNGGLLVSDALGVQSVEQFYDDTGQEFPHRRVAKDALLAGNDVLFLDDFALGSGNTAAELANIKDTVLWFREKYDTDPSFRLRVDEAVRRILLLKLRLYGRDFNPANVLPDLTLPNLNPALTNSTLIELAQTAVTLISPSADELAARLPIPPGSTDQIIIFTDVQTTRQCPICPSDPLISVTALEERILALYGPEASEQVQPNRIRSFSFTDLQAFLDAGSSANVLPPPITPTPTPPSTIAEEFTPEPIVPETPPPTPTPPPAYWVQEWLRDANWLIFALDNPNTGTSALTQFLAQRTDLLRDRKVIVFAYGAPYYLDTTEISKLTAYYSIYNPSDAAIDASVRALFQEVPLTAALPVSVDSIGYDLFRQTQPDPDQILSLFVVGSDGQVQAPPREEPLNFSVGNTLRLQTGVILDHNGHPVPDGTLVQFIQQDRIQGLINIIADKSTVNGRAILDYVLEARTGQFRITAVAGLATRSQEVDIVIADDAQVTIITPTPAPTASPTPTPTPTATPTPTPTPTPRPSPSPTATPTAPEEPSVRILFSQLQMLLSMSLGLVVTAVFSLFMGRHTPNLEHRVGGVLWSLVGALVGYIYLKMGLPGIGIGSAAPDSSLGSWGGLLATLTGGSLSLALYRLLRHRE